MNAYEAAIATMMEGTEAKVPDTVTLFVMVLELARKVADLEERLRRQENDA